MPRLCPHCHKLGISVWKTLWASPSTPIECSHCHQLVRLKPDWTRRAWGLVIAVAVTLCLFVFRLPEAATVSTVLALMVIAAERSYHRAKFEPINGSTQAPHKEQTS